MFDCVDWMGWESWDGTGGRRRWSELSTTHIDAAVESPFLPSLLSQLQLCVFRVSPRVRARLHDQHTVHTHTYSLQSFTLVIYYLLLVLSLFRSLSVSSSVCFNIIQIKKCLLLLLLVVSSSVVTGNVYVNHKKKKKERQTTRERQQQQKNKNKQLHVQ